MNGNETDAKVTTPDGESAELNANDYLAKLTEIRETMIDRAEYDRIKADNKKLINALANGETVAGAPASAADNAERINDLRKKLFNRDAQLSNLEYAETALQLRDLIIDDGGPDIFLPRGHEVLATNADMEAATRVADVLRYCVEYADGNSDIFTDELQRRMIDSKPLTKR